jgi:hypothetical protein
VLGVSVLLAAALVLPSSTSRCSTIGLSALVALGLVLLTGVGGLTSFGQAAFVGLGAYTTAWLTTAQDLPGWLASSAARRAALVAGLVITATVAVMLGSVTPAVGPLPAAGHHRLGHQPVFPVRQHGVPGRPRRHVRHPADQPVRFELVTTGSSTT